MSSNKKYYLGKEQNGGTFFRVLPEAPTPNIRFTPLKFGAPTNMRFIPVNTRPDDEAFVIIRRGPFVYRVRTPAREVRGIVRCLRCSDVDYRTGVSNNLLRNFTIEVPSGKFQVYMSYEDIRDFINKIEQNYGTHNRVTIVRELGDGKQMSVDEAMNELKKMY